MPPVISINNLSVRYDQATVLEDIHFELDEGKVLGIVGPNGAGKTTLFRSILGLQPYRGAVSLFSMRSSEAMPVVGYVPQRMSFEPIFPATVSDVVNMGIISYKKIRRVHRTLKEKGYHDVHLVEEDDSMAVAIAKVLDLTDLTHLKDRRIGTLSGGEMQRVFVAHALIKNPLLLILDEPVNSMDVESQRSFYYMVNRANKEYNITAVMSLHDLETLREHSDRVLCINQRMLFEGEAEVFFANEDYVKMYTEASVQAGIHHSHAGEPASREAY